jgi:hypothetical protein
MHSRRFLRQSGDPGTQIPCYRRRFEVGIDGAIFCFPPGFTFECVTALIDVNEQKSTPFPDKSGFMNFFLYYAEQPFVPDAMVLGSQ